MRLLTLWKLDPPPSTGKIPVDPQARRLVADGRAINADCLNKLDTGESDSDTNQAALRVGGGNRKRWTLTNRDMSEKIVLGLAKLTHVQGVNDRLLPFNQETLHGSLPIEDS
ncbi:hypothetical protein PCASD_24683 [Puccinia coronata f. sp. avenae]|uniref:Uncharacterized protein n=1 Tax=Puccinia coronata f. sp. avenae TaxID=200324 RepID=A0A2N5TKY5_9BASI|nr:hypothetical protein PCASD_24683 [Puccinia coronata f. sp. avenae]